METKYLKIRTKVKLKSGIEGSIIGIWHNNEKDEPQYGVEYWDKSGSKNEDWYYPRDFDVV